MSESSIDKLDEIQAESSPADDEGAKSPGSMLEAVMASVTPEPEVDPTPSPDVETEEEGEPDSEVETDTEEELPPFHEHPRWQQMLSDNRELKDRVKIVDELENYISESGLEMSDVDQGIELMRLLTHEPEKALEALAPIIDQIQQFNGQGPLPVDLQDAVDAGKITEEYAQQLSSERVQSKFYQNRVTKIQTQVKETTEAEREEQLRETEKQIKQSVDKWEEDWKKSDPDFNKKHQQVHDRVIALALAEGPPATPEEGVALAERARNEVEKYLKTFIPRKAESRTVTGGSSANTAPEPKSLKEAIANAVQGAQ